MLLSFSLSPCTFVNDVKQKKLKINHGYDGADPKSEKKTQEKIVKNLFFGFFHDF
ncbi:hypothetical protein MUSASHINO07_12000 [Gemella sp. Musashino-2025]